MQVEDVEGEEEPGKVARNEASTVRKSLGGASAFSGTTARTSQSAHDLEELTWESLLEALPDIDYAAERLLEFIVSSERWESDVTETTIATFRRELASKSSATRNKYRRLSSAFGIQRQSYGTNFFIDVRAVMKTLTGSKTFVDKAQEPWRPDPLLQKANIAAFASTLFSPKDVSEDVELLAAIDQTFPKPFFDDHDPPSSNMLQQTIELAIELRTRFAILLIIRGVHQTGFNADTILSDVFTEGESVRGWSSDFMQPSEFSKKANESIINRMSHIRDISQQAADRSQSYETLNASFDKEFPWVTTLGTAIQWAKARLVEIQLPIDRYGGSERIISSLTTELERTRGHQLMVEDEIAEHDDEAPLDNATSQVSERPVEQVNQPQRKGRASELQSEAFEYGAPTMLMSVYRCQC